MRKDLFVTLFLVFFTSPSIWAQCSSICTSQNTFLGLLIPSGVTGTENVAIGQATARFLTSGSQNTVLGRGAGINLGDANRNVIIGYLAGRSSSIGDGNVFIGSRVGESAAVSNRLYIDNFNTSSPLLYGEFDNNLVRINGDFEVTGQVNLNIDGLNLTGSNVYLGDEAGDANRGVFNTFVGDRAGLNNTGSRNAFFGADAGLDNTSGDQNTAFGTAVFANNTTGDQNTALGFRAALNNTTGSNNVAIGYDAGYTNQTGSGNVFLGSQAGRNELGSNKLYIENSSSSDPLIYGDFDQNIVNVNGALGVGIQNPERPIHLRASNAIFRIDRDRDDPGFAVVRYDQGFNNVWKNFYFYTRAFGPNNGKFVIADWEQNVAGPSLARLVVANNGNVGIGDFLFTNPSQKLHVAGNALAVNYFNSSDQRLKKNIKEVENALASLDHIHGFTYQFKEDGQFEKRNLPAGQKLGLLAQEVQKVYPELVVEDEEGFLAVNYDGMIPVLVEALREEKQKREALEDRLAQLEVKLQNQEAGSEVNLSSSTLPLLRQNEPNPFDQRTKISFFLPQEIQSAALFVYDLNGRQIKRVVIAARGEAQISFEAGALKAGMYLYALTADGKEVAMKRMMITE